MTIDRPYVLTIAGHDPSVGAGLGADLKVFEQKRVYGLSVCTAVTVQNDALFKTPNWVAEAIILAQLELLLSKYAIKVVKVGLIENLEVLHHLVLSLKDFNPDCEIIWDPILKASAGFVFHEKLQLDLLIAILKELCLITPNLTEFNELKEALNLEDKPSFVSQYCNLLLKGGHAEDHANDVLYTKTGLVKTIAGEPFKGFGKHGTGCVLSAAIASEVALGKSLSEACALAKRYTEDLIKSNASNLGYHNL